MTKSKNKKPFLYRTLSSVVRLFYKKRKFLNKENVPDQPCLFIGNHAQAHGPLTCELYFPFKKKIWSMGQMMKIKEVPAFAYKDFWSFKSRWTKWFYKILSYLIAPLSVYIFNRADTIGVFKDTRIISTFKKTLKSIQEGDNIIIFPEYLKEHNEIVNDFHDKFIDIARMYYKKHGVCLSFVPMYNAATIKTVVFGKPITYNPNIEINEQRKIICDHIKDEITKMAKELPVHTVIPYKNISKKLYPKSKQV